MPPAGARAGRHNRRATPAARRRPRAAGAGPRCRRGGRPLAFYTLFSLAPVVIIAVAVIGVVFGEEAARGEIVAQLQGLMGHEAAQAVERAVARSRLQESGLLPTLFGVGALMVGATTVFAQMQAALNAIWGVAARPTRNSLFVFLKSRLLSLTVVLAIGFVLLVSLLLGVVLRAALHFTHRFLPEAMFLMSGAELLLSWAAVWALFCAIFKILPDVVLGWRDVVVGAHRHRVDLRRGRVGGADPALGLLLVADPALRRGLHPYPAERARGARRAAQLGRPGPARGRHRTRRVGARGLGPAGALAKNHGGAPGLRPPRPVKGAPATASGGTARPAPRAA